VKRGLGLLLAASLVFTPFAVDAAQVSGIVVDRAGKPIEYANVALPALKLGAVTDETGRFTLDLPAGRVVLEVTQIGYQRARLEVTVGDAASSVRVTLAEESVPVAEVVVAASSFGKVGKSEGATLRRMDVVTTPGGAADVFQALRALPGINAPDEGAALYVRGGDPRETMIRLDGGEIGHPYHYEGASGGLFSAFDAYMLKSAFFSSGGFSAKYGGVLSGVLDIETQDPMNLRTISVGANIVGAGVSSSWALVPDRLSFVGTMRFSAVDLLDQLYGSSSEYVAVPSSRDGAGKLLYRYSPTGRLGLLYLGATDRVGVRGNYLNFADVFTQRSRNHFAALQFQDAIGQQLALRGQVAIQRYRTGWDYGPIRSNERENNAQANLDAVWAASPRHELSFGANYRHRSSSITGDFLVDSTDFQPGAPTRRHETNPTVEYPGVYLEDKVRLWGPVYATLGGRVDYVSLPDQWTFDPRAALAWRIDERQTLRVAGGHYHQLADPKFMDPVFGNEHLTPLEADHAIAGYEWKTNSANVRVEAFRKDYRDLVTNFASTFYSNDGHGYARGADLFVQGRHARVSGWLSYGYLDTRRKELDDPRQVPASYGVTHSTTLVGIVQLRSHWQLGAKYSYATGRPYTPVIGATYDSSRSIWRPIEAENNAGRLPDYNRLDVRLTRLFTIPAGIGLPASGVCVFYLEAMNVLDIRNALDYVYSHDYSRRYTTDSYFSRRIVVAGFALSW
jgi:vitamin B12 transporter